MVHPAPRYLLTATLPTALLTAVFGTWPVVARIHSHVLDGAAIINARRAASGRLPDDYWAGNIFADTLSSIWILNWDIHALFSQPLSLFEGNIFFPAPAALARAEHMFTSALMGAPGGLLAGPVATHQSALLLVIFLSVCTTSYVVARWTGSLTAGLAAGVLFALSPFHQQNLYHLQSVGTEFLPLMLFGLERFSATGARRFLGAGAAALALQILSGQYLGFFAIVTWGVTGAIALAVGRSSDLPRAQLIRDAAWYAGLSVMAALAVLPFALPYLALSASGQLPDNLDRDVSTLYSGSVASLASYLIPHRSDAAQIPAFTWLLMIFGIAACIRDPRQPRRAAGMALAMGVVGALIAFGPRPESLGVYQGLSELIPGFSGMRVPKRAVVLPQLAAAILAGFGAAAVISRLPRAGGAIVSVLVALSVMSAWRGPFPLRALAVGADLPAAYAHLRRCGGGDPLLELPEYGRPAVHWRDAERAMYAAIHWLPTLNGRTGYAPESYRTNMWLARQLPAPDSMEQLRSHTGLRWLLVHCDPESLGRLRAREKKKLTQICRENPFGVRKRDFGEMKLYDLGAVDQLPRGPRRVPAPRDCTAEE